ncbi:MAG: HNH endonuclease [Actinobacteria bacterium]|nr:HNH endonuclease [Actinomycetota bacterium]
MIRLPDHPRVQNQANMYVFEHILVMEEMLGRYLTADETIHHRNGVRDDNRPKNLELWVKPQPSGVRVEDAIAWAWEILGRYDGLEQVQQGSDDVA